VGGVQSQLERLQKRLSNTRLFGKGVTKEQQEAIMESMKEIQAKVTSLTQGLYVGVKAKSFSMLLSTATHYVSINS
jgi:hypothetical protein